MAELHTFARPDVPIDTRQVGMPYHPDYTRYDEGARYLYSGGAHELSLFWPAPTAHEINGFRLQPIEVALHSDAALAFLLYRIDGICEWSDCAFHVQRVPEVEREIPQEPAGERARFRLFLVDSETGLICARRIVSFDKVMTQALKHTMIEQAQGAYDPLRYELALQQTHAQFADSDALLKVAEFQEMTFG